MNQDYIECNFLKNMPELDLCKRNLIDIFNEHLDMNNPNYDEESFIEWMNCNKDTIQSFTKNFPILKESFNYWLIKILFCFVRNGNLVDLKLWINLFNIKDLNIFSDYRNSILSCACFNNMYHIATFLVKKGANVNTKNNKGKTAMHRIMQTKENNPYKQKIFKLLKDNGSKLNYIDKEGNTAFHYALENKNIEYAYLLSDNGNNSNLKNKDNLYPIQLFSKNVKDDFDLKLFDKLITECKSINIDILDKYGNNLLLYACGQNNFILASHLIKKYKMSINNHDRIKDYILRYIDNNWIDIYRLFLQYFPDKIDIKIYNYCRENNELMAYNTFFYIANNSISGNNKVNLNAQDPLVVIQHDIQKLITAK